MVKSFFWVLGLLLFFSQNVAAHSISIGRKQTNQDSLEFIQKRTFFNEKVATVEFVSLNPVIDGYRRIKLPGELVKKKRMIGHFESIFRVDSTIDMTRFDERKFANDSVKDALEKILFQYPEPRDMIEYLCYEPRNCLLFYDADKGLLGIMEICFECLGVQYTSNFPMRLNLSMGQFEAIKRLFAIVGIKRGIE